jgi:hypothetical protein
LAPCKLRFHPIFNALLADDVSHHYRLHDTVMIPAAVQELPIACMLLVKLEDLTGPLVRFSPYLTRFPLSSCGDIYAPHCAAPSFFHCNSIALLTLLYHSITNSPQPQDLQSNTTVPEHQPICQVQRCRPAMAIPRPAATSHPSSSRATSQRANTRPSMA